LAKHHIKSMDSNTPKQLTTISQKVSVLKKQFITLQSKHIFEIILAQEKLKKLTKAQINYLQNVDNFSCEFNNFNNGFGDNGRYFKATLGNLTMESYPVGHEQRETKFNGEVFIEEHHWYSPINECLDMRQKNKLVKMCDIKDMTANKYYGVVCFVYDILRNFDYCEFGN